MNSVEVTFGDIVPSKCSNFKAVFVTVITVATFQLVPRASYLFSRSNLGVRAAGFSTPRNPCLTGSKFLPPGDVSLLREKVKYVKMLRHNVKVLSRMSKGAH